MLAKKNKLNGVQYLRGYAAILVVINHLWPHNGYIYKKLNFENIGGFGVDIFFVISGFIMAYTLNDFTKKNNHLAAYEFIKKRVERIYPLYFVILAPSFIIYVLKCMYGSSNFSIATVLGSVLLLPSFNNSESYHMIMSPAWTLVYEMFFYVTLSLIIAISKSKNTCIVMYSLIITAVVFSVNIFGLKGDRLGWVNLSYMVGDPIFFDFIMGFIIFYMKKVNLKTKLSRAVMIFIVVIITLFAMFMASKGLPRILSFGLTSFILVLLFTVNIDSIDNGRFQKEALLLGGASYSIYLTHQLFILLADNIYKKYAWLNSSDFFGLLLSMLVILFGCLVYMKIEKKITAKIKKPHRNTSI